MTIKLICDAIKQSFKNSLKPANILPSVLLLCSLGKRTGLSCSMSTANIIANQALFNAPTDAKLPDGQPNMMNALINIIVAEVFRALREDAAIQIVIPNNSIIIQSNGSNSAGPVISVGSNMLPVTGSAIIQ